MEKIWKVLDPAPQSFYDQYPELPQAVLNLLYHRNITTQEKIDEFINPDYSKDIHDPFLFKDMNKALERISRAITNQEKIVVHGDYDADGVSASVILISTLRHLGVKYVDIFLPHRETDGYGLNKNTIQKFIDEKINLIITCDCGVSNVEEITMAVSAGIDVIVTDHHAVPKTLPPALAIIHPQVPGETYPDKGLAGGGVAFKLAQALLKNHCDDHESVEKWLLDMVAIASVGDMVPLLGESRTLTKYGLIVLNKTRRLGLQKLLLEAGILDEQGKCKREISADTIGFQIAPRINAAGRMNHANTAYNLLMTTDPVEAVELAQELDQNNQDRQKTTEGLVKQVIKDVEENQKENPVLFFVGQNWSTGLVGLIAGRIKDKFYKPTIVMAENDGEITGSGRSIENFNLIESLQAISECFSRFGGHPMACGFTLANKNKLEEFKQKLIERFISKTKDQDIFSVLNIDAEIDLDNVDWELFDILDQFKPFGIGNEKPKYLARDLTITGLEPVGKDAKHLRIMVKHNSHKIRKTIGWSLCNGNGTNWCEELKKGDKIDMIFEIDVNEWNGNRELQLTIVDLRHSS
ncbi:MAG: single-stranded-DNA-specific exonuclease RecJ [Candidatus Magasanikiibacteriota bacterium]